MKLPKTSIRPASAEALFGSTARGDADAHSDRDFLIVDNDPKVLVARSAELEAQGASVASYTFAKLKALSTRGALFVQHLKLEAQIYRDTDGRLGKLLAQFRPRTSYTQEISDNAAFATLAANVPTGGRGMLFAADILYVGVRNHGVLSLAERGIHVYGFNAVAGGLEAEGLIAPGGARALSSLRFLKSLYRNGECVCDRSIHDKVKAALEVLPAAFFPSSVNMLDPLWIIDAPSAGSRSAYFVLRELERRLLALQALKLDPRLNSELAQLARWIANPRAYASISQSLAPDIQAKITEIAKIHVPGIRWSGSYG